MFTDFTAVECRLKAEEKLALAERGGATREVLLADAAAWLLLAERLEDIEAVLARAGKRGLMH